MGVVNILYARACEIVRETGTLDSWVGRTGLAKNTIREIRDAPETSTHHASTRLKLIDAAIPSEDAMHYALLSDSMGMRAQERKQLDAYVGNYKYVRKGSDGLKTHGHLQVKKDEETFKFDHIPEKIDGIANLTDRVAHTGFVFMLGRRLTFWGVGARYTRAMMAVDFDTPDSGVLSGIVLTTDNKKNEPMASYFLLVHDSNPEFAEFETEYLERYEQHIEARGSSDELGLLKI